MVQKQRQDAAINALRMIPTKWAVIIVVAIIGYVLLQPQINKWFGLSLPSVASLVGDEKQTSQKKQEKFDSNEKTSTTKADSKASKAATEEKPDKDDSVNKAPTSQPRVSQPRDSQPRDSQPRDSQPRDSQPRVSQPTVGVERDSEKVHGFLTEIGRNRFESPAGLVYGPGSEEGHRLKHIERHLEDQPKRPGSHGVFEGDMHAFLVAIDDAYSRAKSGDKGTKKIQDEGSTIYEASFKKPIGFLGGQEGGRKRNPPLKQLRVVVRGNSLITAFPF
ncbi:MAG: hypothetical protein K9M08_07505 [Pirellula sp.]|nr:hypothetical protein [Pirellula sp.]